MEIWKPLKDFEEYYEVSSKGKIRRLRGKILSIKALSSGYPCFSICINGKQITQRVHVAVAKTFLNETYKEGFVVNHKDGNKLNNNIENLEWISVYKNNKHSINTGLKGYKATPIIQFDEKGNFIKEFKSQVEAEKTTGICRKQINNCLKNKQKSAHKFMWKYKE